jgi:RNA polymerase sigma factor (sigma-70 family)
MVPESRPIESSSGSEQLYAALRQFAYVLSGDRFTAEDLTQVGLLRAAQARVNLSDPRSIAYVRTVIVNLWRMSRRKAEGERRAWLLRRPLTADDPMAALDETDRIWRVLRTLPRDVQCCIVLRYYEDLPIADIGQVLQMPVGTVKSHLSRGLGRISEKLEVR